MLSAAEAARVQNRARRRCKSSTKPGNSRATCIGSRRSHGRTDSLRSAVLTEISLYGSACGRFLQTDPIPGGSANNYDYANQDPVNGRDLDGRCDTVGHAQICSQYHAFLMGYWSRALNLLPKIPKKYRPFAMMYFRMNAQAAASGWWDAHPTGDGYSEDQSFYHEDLYYRQFNDWQNVAYGMAMMIAVDIDKQFIKYYWKYIKAVAG